MFYLSDLFISLLCSEQPNYGAPAIYFAGAFFRLNFSQKKTSHSI